jgi:phosphoglycerate dehydrogenase-like enzyme
MLSSSRTTIVVEDDPFLRLIQVILDPATPRERVAAFSHFMSHDEVDFPGWCARLRARIPNLYPAEVRLVANETDLLSNLVGAQVVAVETLPVGAREITAAQETLKIVQKYGTLTHCIDQATCKRRGVRVLTIRRRANIATAEHAFMLLLALARRITRSANLVGVEQLRAAGHSPTVFDRMHTPNGNWARIKGLRTLYGQQLGIVGFGEIGREVALRAAAFGMRLVYTQRHPLPDSEERTYQARYATLDELLGGSDAVSLHLPGGAATRGIIGRHEFDVIKPDAVLVNVSQPGLVDRAALVRALGAGRLGGFGLDIFYEEPGDTDDPLLAFSNVIITPHLGGSPRFNALSDFEEMLLGISMALARSQ